MTRAGYDSDTYSGNAAENYEKFFVPAIGGPLAQELIAAASLQPGERILDVACGTGVVTRLAAQQVGNRGSVAGLDVNPGMLSVARAVTPSELTIDWYETSAEATPLPDAAFDVVLCQMGLQFIPDRLRALRETRRVLRPGGRVVLNLPGPTPALFSAMSEALATHIGAECAEFVALIFSLYDADELRSLLHDAGFSDVDVSSTPRTLRVPAPRDFLWQYIYSTPLVALVENASEEQRRALEDEISERWQEFVVDDGMRLEVDVTTVLAK